LKRRAEQYARNYFSGGFIKKTWLDLRLPEASIKATVFDLLCHGLNAAG